MISEKEVKSAKSILKRWITHHKGSMQRETFVQDCRTVLGVLEKLTPGVK